MDLIFTAILKIEAPLGRDNRAVASSFLAPTYESGHINSPTLGSFSFSPFCCLLPLAAPCCSSSVAVASASLLVLTDSGRCIDLLRPERMAAIPATHQLP